MAEFAVSDAVLDAYLTQARRDVEQGDVESIALPVAAMAAILDECSRWRHGEFWDAAMALKSRAEVAEAALAAARAEAQPQMGYRTIKQLAERIADEQRVSEVAEWLADRIIEANDDGEELHGLARLLLAGDEKYRLVDADPVVPPTEGDRLAHVRSLCDWHKKRNLTLHPSQVLAILDSLRWPDPPPSEAVWCHCLGTPEPTGNWVYPNDVHADTCGADVPARDPVRERREHEERLGVYAGWITEEDE